MRRMSCSWSSGSTKSSFSFLNPMAPLAVLLSRPGCRPHLTRRTVVDDLRCAYLKYLKHNQTIRCGIGMRREGHRRSLSCLNLNAQPIW